MNTNYLTINNEIFRKQPITTTIISHAAKEIPTVFETFIKILYYIAKFIIKRMKYDFRNHV